jgi:hypothetical protein
MLGEAGQARAREFYGVRLGQAYLARTPRRRPTAMRTLCRVRHGRGGGSGLRWARRGLLQSHGGLVDRAEAGGRLSRPEKLEGSEWTSRDWAERKLWGNEQT